MFKKFTLFFILILFAGLQLHAQAAFNLHAPDTCADAGESIAVALTSQTTVNTASVEFSLSFDPALLTLDSFDTGGDLLGLPAAAASIPGQVDFSWLPPQGGQSLPEPTDLLILYFTVNGSASSGAVSGLDFSNVQVTEYQGPLPSIVTTAATNGSLTVDCATFLPPQGLLTLEAVAADIPCEATSYQVDIVVDSFEQITQTSFTLEWDPTLLDYDFVDNLAALNGLSMVNFGDLSGQGKLTFYWEGIAETLPDGSILFSIVFQPTAQLGDVASLSFSDDPIAVEAEVNDIDIPVITINGNGQVVDNFAPQITCPDDVSVANPMGMPSLPVEDIAPAEILENCGLPAVTYTLNGATTGSGNDDASGEYFNIGTTTVTYTAEDEAGNTGSCSFAVAVADTFKVTPVGGLAQCGGDFVVDFTVENFNGLRGLQFTVTWDTAVLEYDTIVNVNLPATVGFGELTVDTLTFSWFDMDDTGETYPNGFSIFGLRFKVVGELGETTPVCIIDQPTPIEASVSGGMFPATIPVCVSKGEVEVVDTLPPNPPMPPADTTVACAADVPAAQPLTATLACAGEQTVEPTDEIIPGDCVNEFLIIRTWTFTGSNGEEISVIQNIIVEDNTPPSFNFPLPQDTTVNCDAVPDFFQPTADDVSDNCTAPDDIQINIASSIVPGDCDNEYTLTRSWSIEDECGNVNTHSRTIFVQDTTPPQINVSLPPADVTVSCETDPQPFIVSLDEVSDNCSSQDSLTITAISSIAPGDCPNEYFISYSVTISDECGNAVSYGQNITVVDETGPEIDLNAPADVTVECGASTEPADIGLATAIDNCSPADSITVTFADEFEAGCGATGVITRTWTAEDECGNETTAVQVITIEDTTPPALSIPNNVTVECGESTDPSATGEPTAMDLCSEVEITFSDSFEAACGNTGTLTRTWTATDACGNSASAAQQIVIEDTTVPVVETSIPGMVNAECDNVPAAPVLTADEVSDNCSNASDLTIEFNETNTPGSCPNEFTLTRMWTVTDECDNATTVMQVVSVSDNTAPVALCQDITIDLNQNGNAVATGMMVNNGSSDNCSAGLGFSLSQTAFGCDDLGANAVLLTVTDECGNASSCSALVTVEDNIAPTLNCPNDIVVNLDPGACEAIVDWEVSATDNCPLTGIGTVNGFQAEYDPANWTVNITGDGSVNTNNAPNSVTLVGANDGTFGGQTNLCITMTAPGDLTFTWNYSSANTSAFWDPFGYTVNGAFTQLTTTAGGLNQSGTTTVNLDAGDVFCFSQRTVDGVFGAGTTVISNFSGPATFMLQPTQTQGPPSGSFFEIGTTTIGYEITDLAGNTSFCEFDITVKEFPNPIASLNCNDLVNISLDEDCEQEIGADLVLEGGPYGCYDDYIVTIEDEFGVEIGNTLTGDQVGQTVTVIITDPETGNSCEGEIFVEDKIPPVVTCTDITVNCDDSLEPDLLVGSARTNSFTYDGDPLPLFDGCANGVLEVPFDVNMDGVIADVDVALQIQHSWIGDLSAALQAPDGTTIMLFERPGTEDDKCFDSFAQNGNNGDLGCSADDIAAIFDNKADNSAEFFETLCISGMNGTFKPLQSTAKLFGKQAAGQWKLLIYDAVNSGIQTGNFLGATLVISAGELGEPVATDACGDVTLEFDDDVQDGTCNDPYLELITRTWTATDESGNTSTCEQIITVERNSLDDVILPPNRDGIAAPVVSCDNPCTDPVYQPGDPCYVPGAPFGGGTGEPSDLSCGNLGAFYEDLTFDETCEGSFTIVREWTLTDWCTGEIVNHNQIIKVKDTTAPVINCPSGPIQISADNNCQGNWFVTGFTATDNCSSSVSFRVRDAQGNTFNNGQIITGLDIGQHIFTLFAEDDCGNTSTCSVTVQVLDLTPPVAICDEFTTIGLGNLVYDADPTIPGLDANAELCFGTVDDGSYDNCGVEAIKLRRLDGKLGSQQFFKDCVYFNCDDIGQSIMVEMRVYDQTGSFAINDPFARFNACMVEVEVSDKVNPVIACPPSKTIECWEYDSEDIDGIINVPIGNLPADVPPAYLTVRKINQLTGQIQSETNFGYIGGYPGALDNCEVDSVRVLVIENVNNCGTGTVTRFYQAYEPLDPDKTTPDFSQCVQVITLQHTTPFDICDTQPWNTPALGCSFGHSLDDGVEWPADITLNGCGLGLDPEDLEQNPDVNPFDVRPRIFDDFCDLIGVDYDDTYLVLNGQGGASECIKLIRKWIVVDWCQEDPSFDLGYVTWTYNQEIKVLESNAPVFDPGVCDDITICMEDDECDFVVSGQFSNHDWVTVTATDDCTDADNLNYFYKLDAFNDGIGAFGGYDFTSDFTYRDGDNRNFPSPPNLIDTLNHDDNPATRNIVEGKFPAGVHKIFWKVEDGCGNVTTCEYTFEVKDCKQPTPVCHNSIVSVVMPSSGEVDLLASFFNAGSYDNCTDDDDLIIAFSDQVTFDPLTGAPIYDTVRTFTCDDLGMQEIEIWVKDAPVGYDDGDVLDDNWDFCVSMVEIQDPNGVCPSTSTAKISGLIHTELDNPIQDAEVSLNNMSSGGLMQMATTPADGKYNFNAPLGNNYSVTPEKDINYLNGVSTFDLVLISQHILGVYPFQSPYQYIAADATNDQKVSTFDILEIRKLILQIIDDLPNNDSWRFVDAAYQFPNPDDPFTPPFPEVIDINNLSVNELDNDFVGVKIGDIDYSAQPNQLMGGGAQSRRVGELVFQAEDREVKAGETVELHLRATDFREINGYQFTIDFDPERVEFVDVQPGVLPDLSVANFGLALIEKGAITTSWNGREVRMNEGDILFTLSLRAKEDMRRSEMIRFNSRFTAAEAYDADYDYMDVALRFFTEAGEAVEEDAFVLFQNQPNPFKSETVIGFQLPEATRATLTIYDVSGKVLKVLRDEYSAGYHALTIDRSELPASGMLYYKLETEEDTATKKMLLID